MKASWKARQRGVSMPSRFRSARATARFATRKASSASASSASDGDAALDPVGGDAGEAQQFLGRLAPRCLRASRCSPAAPRSTRGTAPRAARSAASAAAPSASAPSASIESSTPGTSTVAVFSTSALGIHARAEQTARAVHDLPLGRDAVAGRILRRVGVVEVGHLLVPLRRPARRAGPAAARRARRCAPRSRLGRRRRGRAPSSVDGARWFTRKTETERVPCGMCSSRSSAEIGRSTTWSWRPPEPGTSCTTGSLRARERHRDRRLARVRCQTDTRLAVRALDLRRRVVAPAHGHGEGARLLRHEEAQAHRGREEALLGGLALLVRLLGEARRLRDLARGRRPRRRRRSSRAACPTGSGSRSGTSSRAAPSPAAAPRRARVRPRGRRGRASGPRPAARAPRARCGQGGAWRVTGSSGSGSVMLQGFGEVAAQLGVSLARRDSSQPRSASTRRCARTDLLRGRTVAYARAHSYVRAMTSSSEVASLVRHDPVDRGEQLQAERRLEAIHELRDTLEPRSRLRAFGERGSGVLHGARHEFQRLVGCIAAGTVTRDVVALDLAEHVPQVLGIGAVGPLGQRGAAAARPPPA